MPTPTPNRIVNARSDKFNNETRPLLITSVSQDADGTHRVNGLVFLDPADSQLMSLHGQPMAVVGLEIAEGPSTPDPDEVASGYLWAEWPTLVTGTTPPATTPAEVLQALQNANAQIINLAGRLVAVEGGMTELRSTADRHAYEIAALQARLAPPTGLAGQGDPDPATPPPNP